MVTTVIFSFLTPANIRRSEIARSFFNAVKVDLNGASLGRYGDVEPLAYSFQDGTDFACQLWGRDLFWTDSRISGSGAVLHGTSRRHANVSFYFDFKTTPEASSWTNLLKRVSDLFQVDFSFVHCFANKSQSVEDEVFEGITSHDIQEALPTIPWACCFGRPYIELMGEAKLKSAGFYAVEFVNEHLVCCQLTSNPLDYIVDYEAFRNRQEAVKSNLGNHFFLGSAKAVVPEFCFERGSAGSASSRPCNG